MPRPTRRRSGASSRRTRTALGRYLAARRRLERIPVAVGPWRTSTWRATARPAADAPAVVMLAGLGVSGRYLLPAAAELGERFPVWVPDLQGYRGRDRPGEVLDVPALGDLVAAWLDVVGLEQVVLVGNSMGCQVAVEAAARHPSRVLRLVLEGPTIDAAARTVPRQVLRIGRAGLVEPPSLAPIQVFDWAGTGPRRIAAMVRHAFAHEVEATLPRVACPALVIRGGRDPIVPTAWARRVADLLPRATLEVVPRGSHAMAYSQPVLLADLVEGFIRQPSHRPAAGPG